MTRRQPLQDLALDSFEATEIQSNAGPSSQPLRSHKRLRAPDESIYHPAKRRILAEDGILSISGKVRKSSRPSHLGSRSNRSPSKTMDMDQPYTSPPRSILGDHNGHPVDIPALLPAFCSYPRKVVPRSPLSVERENRPQPGMAEDTFGLGHLRRSLRDSGAPKSISLEESAPTNPVSSPRITASMHHARSYSSNHYSGFDVYQDSLDLAVEFLFPLDDMVSNTPQEQVGKQTEDLDKENIAPSSMSTSPVSLCDSQSNIT